VGLTQLKYLEFPKGRLATLGEKQTGIGVTSLIILWLSGALSTLLWGLVLGLAASLGHAAMRTKTLKSGFNQLKDNAKDAFC